MKGHERLPKIDIWAQMFICASAYFFICVCALVEPRTVTPVQDSQSSISRRSIGLV